MKIKNDISLKEYNTFGIDAKAACMVEVDDWKDLEALCDASKSFPQPYYPIGQGSNLLFTKDFGGTLIHMTNCGWEVEENAENHVVVRAGAGCVWDEFVEQTLQKGFFGLENLSLIPGTVGSSPVQNIGAYGAEASQFIIEVHCFDWETGEFFTLVNEECQFGYRQSIFKQRSSLIVVWVSFRLSLMASTKTGYKAVEDYLAAHQLDGHNPLMVRQAVIDIRNSKLPDYKEFGNAGSFFKNPVIEKSLFDAIRQNHPEMPFYVEPDERYKIPAAWLIEQCGWKGHREGSVGVHDKQPLILVNLGAATGSEVLELSTRIQESIKNNFGILLYPEVIMI